MVNEFPAGSYFSKILDHVEIYGILSSSVGYESERGDLLELIAINREQLVKCVGQECGALELLASEMAAKGHRELVDVLLPPNGEACGWIM